MTSNHTNGVSVTYNYDDPNGIHTGFTYDQLNRVSTAVSQVAGYSYKRGPTGTSLTSSN